MMLKATENKATMQSADTFVGTMTGKVIHRHQLEDPQRTGHLREGFMLEPDEWTAAQFWGLRSPSGRRIGFIEPTPDSREPRSDEAPAELRRAAEKARAVVDDVSKRIQALVDERAEAQIEQRRAAARNDAAAYNKALHREQEALARQTDLGPENLAAVKHYSDAVGAVRRWIHDERLGRYERAKA